MTLWKLVRNLEPVTGFLGEQRLVCVVGALASYLLLDGPAVCEVDTSTRCGPRQVSRLFLFFSFFSLFLFFVVFFSLSFFFQPICCPDGSTCCMNPDGVALSCTLPGGKCCEAGHSCGVGRECCGDGCMVSGEACCETFRCGSQQQCNEAGDGCVARTSDFSAASALSVNALLFVAVTFVVLIMV